MRGRVSSFGPRLRFESRRLRGRRLRRLGKAQGRGSVFRWLRGGDGGGKQWFLQVCNLDWVGHFGPIQNVDGDHLFAFWAGSLGHMGTQLNEKKAGMAGSGPALSNVGQASYLLEHFHYSDLSSHTSVLVGVTAVRVPYRVKEIQIPLGSTGSFWLTHRAR